MRKKHSHPRHQSSRSPKTPTVFFAIITALAVLVYLGKNGYLPYSETSSVLGTTRYLTKGGDGDSGGSSGGGSGESGSNSDENRSTTTSGRSSSSGTSGGSSEVGGSGSTTQSVPVTTTTTRSATPRPPKPTERADVEDDEDEDRTAPTIRQELKTGETRTEVRLSETERIRARTKDGQTRIDITSGGVKTRLEYKDDRVVIKAEREDGTEVELEDDELIKIEKRLSASGIKVATAGGEQFVIARGTIGAVSAFPVSIDLATNTLLIQTPAGEKAVTVLPDQAVRNLLAAGVVRRIGGPAVADLARSGALANVSDVVTLAQRQGIPVYEIAGVSEQRLLGFIPVVIPKTVTVSAETGIVMGEALSPLNRLFDLLAF